MLYRIAHLLRDQMPWVWNSLEVLNSFMFLMRYGKKIRKVEPEEIAFFESRFKENDAEYKICPIRAFSTKSLVDFFTHQPSQAYRFFKPHGFDEKSIRRLQKNRAFLGYVVIDTSNNRIAGYCFNRSFFHGKGFRGRMVDIDYRGKGLGTMMNCLLNSIGFGIGLKLFETVSKNNVASYRSSVSASNFKVVKELPHNELYLEILNDMKQKQSKNLTHRGGKIIIIRLQPIYNASYKQERRVA